MMMKLMSKEAALAWVLARKLRVLVGLLLAANLLLAAWSLIFGGSSSQREPQRVLQQHRPETVKVVPAAEADRVRPPAVGPSKPPAPPASAPATSAPTMSGPTAAG
jgi:hypothetical protein